MLSPTPPKKQAIKVMERMEMNTHVKLMRVRKFTCFVYWNFYAVNICTLQELITVYRYNIKENVNMNANREVLLLKELE